MSASLNAPDEGWWSRAKCRGRDSEWDYEPTKTHTPAEKLHAQQAMWICRNRCPVLDRCRKDVLAMNEGSFAGGIVAGMTPAQRKRARRDTTPKPTLAERASELDQAGVSRRDIAERLGITPNAVSAHLSKVRKDAREEAAA